MRLGEAANPGPPFLFLSIGASNAEASHPCGRSRTDDDRFSALDMQLEDEEEHLAELAGDANIPDGLCDGSDDDDEGPMDPGSCSQSGASDADVCITVASREGKKKGVDRSASNGENVPPRNARLSNDDIKEWDRLEATLSIKNSKAVPKSGARDSWHQRCPRQGCC